jgi:hypothetical protein
MTSGHALPRRLVLAGTAGRRRRTGEAGSALIAAVAVATGAVGIAIATAGVTLLLRRLAGGFSAPAAAWVPWAVAAGGIPLVLLVEAAARLGKDRWPAWLARSGLVAAALAVAPFASAVAWPLQGAGLAGTAAALLAALRPPTGWQPPRLRGFPGTRRLGDDARTRPAAPGSDRPGERDRGSPLPPEPADSTARQTWATDWPAALPEGCRQRLERYETPAGEDCIRGQMMLSVAAGSRTGHAHVGFCPAFATLPVVEVTTDCDFVEAEVTAAEVLPWGVRVECRLSEPAEEPLEIPVTIRAVRPT